MNLKQAEYTPCADGTLHDKIAKEVIDVETSSAHLLCAVFHYVHRNTACGGH